MQPVSLEQTAVASGPEHGSSKIKRLEPPISGGRSTPLFFCSQTTTCLDCQASFLSFWPAPTLLVSFFFQFNLNWTSEPRAQCLNCEVMDKQRPYGEWSWDSLACRIYNQQKCAKKNNSLNWTHLMSLNRTTKRWSFAQQLVVQPD